MSGHNDGGPAFPALHTIDGNWVKSPLPEHSGMTLRDYFAASAMQGICASSPSLEWTNQRLAKDAYDLADAMLKERAK